MRGTGGNRAAISEERQEEKAAGQPELPDAAANSDCAESSMARGTSNAHGQKHSTGTGQVVLLPEESNPRHTSKAAQHSRILSPRDEDSECDYAVLSSKPPFWLTELPSRVSKDASPRLL